MTNRTELSELYESDFQPLINSDFAAVAETETVYTYRLIEVKALDTTSENGRRPPFSLVFRGQLIQAPRQGIVKLEHAQLGIMEIFLVPIGPDQQGMCYEAVFT